MLCKLVSMHSLMDCNVVNVGQSAERGVLMNSV